MGPWLPCSRVGPSNDVAGPQTWRSRSTQWLKVHLVIDTATSDIRAVEFTASSNGDSAVLPDLLEQIPEGEEIGTVQAAIPA